MVFISAVLYSLGGVFIKFCTWDSMTINGVRCFFAGIVMLVFVLVTKHKIRFNKAILLGAISNSLANITFVYSTKMTTAGNAIVLQFTMPIFVIIFSYLFFRKEPKVYEVAACAVVFAGICCFFGDKVSDTSMWGNIIGILSGVFYAIMFLQNSFQEGDFESANIYGNLMSAVVGIPFFLSETNYSLVNFGITGMLGFVILGLGTIFFAIGLRTTSPLTAAIVSTIEPILNPVIVAIFYDEKMTLFSLIGAVIVISSIAVYNIFSWKKSSGEKLEESNEKNPSRTYKE